MKESGVLHICFAMRITSIRDVNWLCNLFGFAELAEHSVLYQFGLFRLLARAAYLAGHGSRLRLQCILSIRVYKYRSSPLFAQTACNMDILKISVKTRRHAGIVQNHMGFQDDALTRLPAFTAQEPTDRGTNHVL